MQIILSIIACFTILIYVASNRIRLSDGDDYCDQDSQAGLWINVLFVMGLFVLEKKTSRGCFDLDCMKVK